MYGLSQGISGEGGLAGHIVFAGVFGCGGPCAYPVLGMNAHWGDAGECERDGAMF